MRVWTYVITYDEGGAPNFDPPATTLTVCKPRIRRAAEIGDLALAFNGARLNPAEPHSVRWAGVVSEVIAMKDYWNDTRFQGKKQGRARDLPDNIYRPTKNGELEQVVNDTHKPDAKARDVSGVNALVFKPSWHFGTTVAVLPARFKLRMTGGRRGHHRVEIDGPTWRELKQWLDDNAPSTLLVAPDTQLKPRSCC
jgi:Nucleotide modification associated domain 2